MNKLKHLAIIMDGNGRWAKNQGKNRSFGHEKGSKVLLNCAKWAKKHDIKILTYYAFSSENWKRSEKEISFLFKLPIMFFNKYIKEFISEGIKVNIVGDRSQLPNNLNKKLDEVESITKNNTEIIVNLAINYGSRPEILQATKMIAQQVKDHKIEPNEIDINMITNNLYVKEDVDLLIRTGGEFRVSNFLLWQIAYSEIFVTEQLWPDFNEESLNNAINWYNLRERRFGAVKSE